MVAGSVARGDATPASDVDVRFLTHGASDDELAAIGRSVWVTGVFVDVECWDATEYGDADAILSDPYRAGAVRDTVVLFDHDGDFTETREVVASRYMEPEALARRVGALAPTVERNCRELAAAIDASDPIETCRAAAFALWTMCDACLVRRGASPNWARGLHKLGSVAPDDAAWIMEVEGSVDMNAAQARPLLPLFAAAHEGDGDVPRQVQAECEWMIENGLHREAAHALFAGIGLALRRDGASEDPETRSAARTLAEETLAALSWEDDCLDAKRRSIEERVAKIAATPSPLPEDDMPRYSLTRTTTGYDLATPDGRAALSYLTDVPADCGLTANSACCFYPLLTPSGQEVVDMAPDDHPHHRGLFLTWHSISSPTRRADFWGWNEFAPTRDRVIVNRGVELSRATSERAELTIHNEWLAGADVMVSEAMSVAVFDTPEARVLDLRYDLIPTTDMTLDQSAFGGLCAKCRKGEGGEYRDSQGVVGLAEPHYLTPDTDWPSARWYSYATTHGDDRRTELAIVDHPDNPPTLWHNLAPIAMMNPCTVAPGAMHLTAGQPFRLRYRVAVSDGDMPEGFVDGLANEEW